MGQKTKHLDASGLRCPMPVLRTRRALDEMSVGDRITVTATDPAAVHDMPAFCSMAGHNLLMASEENGTIIFEIEKGVRT